MNFQELIFALERFWADQGCVIQQPYDTEVGAGTFHPATFSGPWPEPGMWPMSSLPAAPRMDAMERIRIGFNTIISTRSS